MKKFMVVGLAALSLALYSCGGGGGKKASNPNDAAEEFQNPTGSLTRSNAKDVANASLKAFNANGTTVTANALSKSVSGKLDPKYFPTTAIFSGEDIQACITTSGSSSTIDWGCVGEADNECDGDGTTVSSVNDTDDFYTIEYNDFNYNCSGNADFDFSCNGTASYSTDVENIGVYCSNLTCEYTDFTTEFDGCVNIDGDYLINFEDGSFVLEDIATDGTCGTFTMTIRDNDSTEEVTCSVSESNQGCSTLSDVVAVTSCSIE